MSRTGGGGNAAHQSYRIALGGIVAGFCLMTMFLTGVFPALYIAAPMVAGVLLMILVEEVSTGWAMLTYVAVSLLSLVVTYDKEAALMFVLFFGYYPILRPYGNRLRRTLPRILWRYLLFNGFLLLDYWLTVYVLGLPTFDDEAAWMLLLLMAAANVVFAMYDRILGRLGLLYQRYILPLMRGRQIK